MSLVICNHNILCKNTHPPTHKNTLEFEYIIFKEKSQHVLQSCKLHVSHTLHVGRVTGPFPLFKHSRFALFKEKKRLLQSYSRVWGRKVPPQLQRPGLGMACLLEAPEGGRSSTTLREPVIGAHGSGSIRILHLGSPPLWALPHATPCLLPLLWTPPLTKKAFLINCVTFLSHLMKQSGEKKF